MTKFLPFNRAAADGGPGMLGVLLLEASFWGGLVILLWLAYLAFSAPDGAAGRVVGEHWLTMGLALAASLVAWQQKRQPWRKDAKQDQMQVLSAQDRLSLAELLRAYGVRQHGAYFLYLPMPVRLEDREAWAWLEVLEAQELLGWRSWRIRAEHVAMAVRQSHPELFEGAPTHFEVFRIERRLLGEVLGDAAA